MYKFIGRGVGGGVGDTVNTQESACYPCSSFLNPCAPVFIYTIDLSLQLTQFREATMKKKVM